MNITQALIALLTSLAAMSVAAEPRRLIIKRAYYSNLLEFTSDALTKVSETKTELELTISKESKLRHENVYRTTRPTSQYQQNEMKRLNTQYNQLKSFIRRIKSAKSTDKSLSFKFTLIKVKLENLTGMLRHFMRKLHIKVEFKVQPTAPTQWKNRKMQTLTMLKDLKYTLGSMQFTFAKEKRNL